MLTPKDAEKIKAIIFKELENDFETNRLHPYSRFKHLKEHIFYKIDQLVVKT